MEARLLESQRVSNAQAANCSYGADPSHCVCALRLRYRNSQKAAWRCYTKRPCSIAQSDSVSIDIASPPTAGSRAFSPGAEFNESYADPSSDFNWASASRQFRSSWSGGQPFCCQISSARLAICSYVGPTDDVADPVVWRSLPFVLVAPTPGTFFSPDRTFRSAVPVLPLWAFLAAIADPPLSQMESL